MADEDWIAIGYDERVDVILDGQLVMLWWGRNPERAQRTLYAQCGRQRVSLALAADEYIAADRTHRYCVTHGAIKAALADGSLRAVSLAVVPPPIDVEVFVPFDQLYDAVVDGHTLRLRWVDDPLTLQTRLVADLVDPPRLGGYSSVLLTTVTRQQWAMLGNGDALMRAQTVTHAQIRRAFGWPDPNEETVTMPVYNMGSRAGRTTFYGPAWGSVDVSDETAAQIEAMSPRRDVTAEAIRALTVAADDYNRRKAASQPKPAPEPTLRPTGGRRFVLDDDE